MLLDRLRSCERGACLAMCCAAQGLFAPAAVHAQAPGAASAPAAEMTYAERAQRDADKVYHWILIHSDKPRKAGAAREDKPAIARAKPSARVADSPAVAAPAAAVPIATLAATPNVPEPAAATIVPTQGVAVATLPPQTESIAVSVPVAPMQSVVPPPAAVVVEAIDEVLTPLFRADPQFSQTLVRSLRKGQVQVRFTVQTDGSVVDPAVVASSNPRLNASALAAMTQWRFAPLQRAQAGVVELGFNID